MTPEQERKLNEIYDWMQRKKIQQITFPLDDPSKNLLGTASDEGLGTTALTQVYSVSGGGGGTVTAPKAYSDTVLIKIGSTTYEIPFLATL